MTVPTKLWQGVESHTSSIDMRSVQVALESIGLVFRRNAILVRRGPPREGAVDAELVKRVFWDPSAGYSSPSLPLRLEETVGRPNGVHSRRLRSRRLCHSSFRDAEWSFGRCVHCCRRMICMWCAPTACLDV